MQIEYIPTPQLSSSRGERQQKTSQVLIDCLPHTCGNQRKPARSTPLFRIGLLQRHRARFAFGPYFHVVIGRTKERCEVLHIQALIAHVLQEVGQKAVMRQPVEVDIEVATRPGRVAHQRRIVALHGMPLLPDARNLFEPAQHVVVALAFRQRQVALHQIRRELLIGPTSFEVRSGLGRRRILRAGFISQPEAARDVVDVVLAERVVQAIIDRHQRKGRHIIVWMLIPIGLETGRILRHALPCFTLFAIVSIGSAFIETMPAIIADGCGVTDTVLLRVDLRAAQRQAMTITVRTVSGIRAEARPRQRGCAVHIAADGDTAPAHFFHGI